MAINPAELMIGNYVMYEGVICKIHTIHGGGSVKLDDAFETPVNSAALQPIPITPELLERCGFKRHEDTINKNIFTIIVNGRQFEIGSDFATIDQFPTALYELTRLGVYHALTNVQYLHQLQNIIYSLTKTKLLLCNSN